MDRGLRGQVSELLEAAWAEGHTPEGVALAEQAVRLADDAQDLRSGYEARCSLMSVASFTGDYDKVLLSFSWCLARFDEQPDEFSSYDLLWKYKWVIEHMIQFPGIGRDQILASLADFRARCLKEGNNERPALFLTWLVELFMGDLPRALEHHAQWERTRRDSMADCEACERNRVAELYAAVGEHEKAIKAAQPILKGRLRCGEIPHLTHATLLRSFWLLGQREAAAEHHIKGYRLVRNNRDFIREQSWHLAHLLRSGELELAAALMRKHLPWALETRNLDYRFYFLSAARAGCRRLLEAGASSLRCRLPTDQFPFAGKTTVPLDALAAWMDGAIAQLTALFDRRNGNQRFAELAQLAEAELK
jgi:hypothetical protein